MPDLAAPKAGTPEWDLWAAGARAEAAIRREGLTKRQRDAVELVRGLLTHRPDVDPADALADALWIYNSGTSLRRRLAWAWKVARIRA